MPEPKVILLVEDREEDIIIIRRAFERALLNTPLHVVRDGEEAIQYLAGEGKYAARAEYPLPALVVLDLKMPKVDGFEVLQWVRAQPGLSSMIVIVLTISQEMADVNKAYDLGANSFLVKPMDFENVVAFTEVIHDYWLMINSPAESTRLPRFTREKQENS